MSEEEALSETIGDRIRRLRERTGLSTAAVAAAAGVGEAAVKKVEAGGSKAPSFKTGVRIAKALGVTPWEIVTGEALRPIVHAPRGLRYEWRGWELHLSLEPGAIIAPEGFTERVSEQVIAQVLRLLEQREDSEPPRFPEAIGQALVAAGNLTEAMDDLRRRLEALESRPRRRAVRR